MSRKGWVRKIKKEKKLGGKGKLTDVLIKKLTKYYGLAIRRNADSAEEMKKAITETVQHLSSTNEEPQHENCPPGSDSWCKWRQAETAGEQGEYSHPPPLHPNVVKNILPIYEDLSKEELLTRGLGGHTQNSNESFNATVWRLAPKHLHAGIKIVEVSAFIAACVFNEGYYSVLKMVNHLDIKIGPQARYFAEAYNEQRLIWQRRRCLSNSKSARTTQILELTVQNDFYEEAEGLLYGPGIAD